MTFDDFVSKYNSQPVETEDPTNPDQCMDLAFAWCDAIGVDRATIRHLYAYQIWTQPQDITVKYFDYIPNTPNGVPREGDIVVFNQTVGAAGHVSIATGKGDANGFQSFDQNWSGAQYAKMVNHVYTSVFGWLHLKAPSSTDPVIINQSDAFIALCTLLNVTANKDLAIAEVNKLITIEDQAPIKDKQLQDALTQIKQLESNLKMTQDNNKILQDNYTASQITLKEDADKMVQFQQQITNLQNQLQQPVKTGWQLIFDGIRKLLKAR